MQNIPIVLAFASPPVFESGVIGITWCAFRAIPFEEITDAINRHVVGDWGNLGSHEIAANNRAIKEGRELSSAYESTAGTRFLITTQADRLFTSVFLPGEF